MGAIQPTVGSYNAVTDNLASLANVTYVNSATITCAASSNKPVDMKVKIKAVAGATVAGNKQLKVMARASKDNTEWTSGPVSGTTTTDEPNLYNVGVVPMNTNSGTMIKEFDLAQVFGNFLPNYAQLVFFNDSGIALASSGHVLEVAEVTLPTV